jgi:DNA ligase (NAD+)
MNLEQAIIRNKELYKLIDKHDAAYYQKDAPHISDAEYDLLRRELEEIEELYPKLISKDSPTQKVGYKVSEGFNKVTHKSPMLSLSNAFSEEDIDDFLEKIKRFLAIKPSEEIEIICEPKIDGASFAAIFKNGEFHVASTRGDGYVGEDITENVRTIKGFPLTLKSSDLLADNVPETLEVRGEIYMSKEEFSRLNQEQEKLGKKLFANPRNAAAGSLRQLDSNITASRNLSYFIYALGKENNDFAQNQNEAFERLAQYGFKVNPLTKIATNRKEILKLYKQIGEHRYNLSYDIDGMVYKVNDFALQERLGTIARSPRWAIAHKFPAEQAVTRLEKITIQIGRTGALTPVANLVPINVGGVMVGRATLHNQDEIERKDIRENDIVTLQRAGDVIPQIVKVDKSKRGKNSQKFIFPKNCPACGHLAVREEGEAIMRCINSACEAQIVERLKHFVSKNAFDIEGLGEKQIEEFYEKGLIANPLDIFTLEARDKEDGEQIRNFEGWGVKSTDNLFKNIEKKRHIAFERFLFALGMRYLGQTTARTLALNYLSYVAWFKKMCLIIDEESNEYQNLININGVGNKVGQAIMHYFADSSNVEFLEKLATQLDIIDFVPPKNDSAIAGKIIVFTGSLEKQTRQEAKARAESLGAKVSNSISKNTDILIAGADSGSKLKKAKELGLNIINEEEWLALL